ncbi:MAG: hypothetical protein BRD50_02285 [Bacteroidetes bacterium SW_11_45_7]|nr:MAG: hypothetical protein BRD50_02285 [Bacteroidetes bacterium SW_11_45_7]
MRILLILPGLLISITSHSQITTNFNPERAKDMAELCNSFTHLDLYGDDKSVIPKGYKKTFTSDDIGMDNKFQVYKKKNDIGVIHIRGSTKNPKSWMANINSAMIPAKGTMTFDGKPFDYTFAKTPEAAVHSGYVISIAAMRGLILKHIRRLNEQGIYDIIITGHSQGGALTNMLMAYLSNLPDETLDPKNTFKAYAFAATMIGNDIFAKEYRIRYCDKGLSYNIVNPEDPITRLPLSYKNNEKEMLVNNLKRFMNEEQSLNFQQMLTDGAALLLQENLDTLVYNTSKRLNRNIERELGPLELPERKDDHNYQYLCNRQEIEPVEYPKVLKDSSMLENEELVTGYERTEEGHFKNEEFYKDESWNYQHKPYNYYAGFLKTYFPKEYEALEPKYLDENL